MTTVVKYIIHHLSRRNRLFCNKVHISLSPASLPLIFFLLSGCANQGFPSGGPKDVTPPVALSSIPDNGTTHFNGKEFYIEFDEYVTIKNQDGILVSPPMNSKPLYSTRSHGVVVKLRDTLLPNTTYLFQFKDAIADFNEGNLLPSLEYVFSTGSMLDTFCLEGIVKDALTSAPWDGTVTVLLYDTANFTDSAVLYATPSYVTRCNKEGYFAFNYIRPGAYHLLALEDADNNLKLGYSEAVAFCDSIVHSYYKVPPQPRDTTLSDSVRNIVDSVQKATAALLQRHSLRITTPAADIQHVTGQTMPRRAYATITTQLPMSQPQLHNLYGDSIIYQLNSKRDTLQIWALSSTLDSMMLALRDTTGVNDTLKLRYRHSKTTAGQLGSGPHSANKRDAFQKTPNALGTNAVGKFNFFDTLWLKLGTPASKIITPQEQWQYGLADDDTAYNGGYIIIRDLDDSSEYRCWSQLYDSHLDAIVYTSGYVTPVALQQSKKYQLVVLPGLFTDIYGHCNDSLVSTFEVNNADAFSNITLNIVVQTWQPAGAQSRTNPSSSNHTDFIFQLLDNKGKVVKQQIVEGPQSITEGLTIEFHNLAPGNYRIRAIEDLNHNAKWDAGNYWQHRQPERAFYFSKNLELRANWEFKEQWNIENEK